MKNFKLLACVVVLTMAISCKSQKQKAEETVYSTPERMETRTQRGGGERGTPPNADEMMSKMDANGDGRLAKTEVKGRLAEKFDTIDTNGDGFITKTELQQASRTQRRDSGGGSK